MEQKWRAQGIPAPPGRAQTSGSVPHQYQSHEAGRQHQHQQPHQSDGAFERFLTAAIATIITIMFSWRMLDQANRSKPAIESSSVASLTARQRQTDEEDEEEEERGRRRENNLSRGHTSENLFTASSSSPLLNSSSSLSPLRHQPSPLSFSDIIGSNVSPVSSSSSSSSPSTPTNAARRRQLPAIPVSHQAGEALTSTTSTSALSSSPSPSSRFQKQQDESLASRLAKISSTASLRGRSSATGGVGYRLTNLSPVIRVPVDDFPLCGEHDMEPEAETPVGDATEDATSWPSPEGRSGSGNPQRQLERQDTPHPNNTGVISETVFDPKQLSALGIDPWGIAKHSSEAVGNYHSSRKGPVLYTDLDADSSEELVDSSLEDAESAAGISITGIAGRFSDSGGGIGRGGGGLARDLLLNVSTDSDSSGGIITKEDRQEEILDPKQFHAVMTAKLRDEGGEAGDLSTGRRSPRRRLSLEEDIADNDEDEFFVVPGDSSYHRHHHLPHHHHNQYSGQRTTTSSDISALGGDVSYHGDSGYHDDDPHKRGGGIMGYTSYYYEDEEDDDDVQPRELDSDEELYLCSVLEPIIEENSDDLSPSSGGESFSSSTTSSSRSGRRTRHAQHDYDVDYQERKHGLIPDPAISDSCGSSIPGDFSIPQSPSITVSTSLPGMSDDFSVSSSTLSNSSQSIQSALGADIVQSSSVPLLAARNNTQDMYSPSPTVPFTTNSQQNNENKTNEERFNSAGSSVAHSGREDRDLNYASNDSLTVGIKARYSIPSDPPRSAVIHQVGSGDPRHPTSDPSEGEAERLSPPTPPRTCPRSGDSPCVTETAARAGGRQVTGEDALNRDGEGGGDDDTVAAGPDTAGDTHAATQGEPGVRPLPAAGRGGRGDTAVSVCGDYNESRPGSDGVTGLEDAGSVGFPQHTRSPAAKSKSSTGFTTTHTTSTATDRNSDDLTCTPEPFSDVPSCSSFSSDYTGNGLIQSVNTTDSGDSGYRSRPVYSAGFDSKRADSVEDDSDVIRGNENNSNNNNDNTSSSSSSGEDKTISYNFHSDVTSGVYSSRIIITGEKEEEVIKSPTFEDSDEDAGEVDLDLNPRAGEGTNTAEQLSVSFPSDTDYYEYVRYYGSSVDLDSPTSPQSRASPVGSRIVPDQSAVLNQASEFPARHPPRRRLDEFDEKQAGDTNTEENLSGLRATSPSTGDSERAGSFSRSLPRRPDQTFARTFSTRVEHDSNSESDESVQTVISRKGSKVSDPATSSSSAGSSHHDSPVHVHYPASATASLSPPSVTRPKRPLSDGCVYEAVKFPREDHAKDAFYRDRIVSEGGGVAFGEDCIGDDIFEGDGDSGREESGGEGLRAYKSYSALHTKGLDLYSDEEKENRLSVFSESECSSPASPQTSSNFVSSTGPLFLSGPGEDSRPGEDQSLSVDASVIKTTSLAFDGADSLTFVVDPPERADDAMDSYRFRPSREEEEAYRYGARPDYGERRVPEMYEHDQPAQHGEDEEDEEWEQSITETFVVPVTPERTIYQTLQNVKHLLDARSPSQEQDDTASTCTTTMVEVDGRNVGGFLGNDDVTSGYRARTDALERVDANLKERLGFQLSMDELKSEGYATESGWPIVRYIEKERVFVEEHGAEAMDGSSVDADERVREGEESGEEYVPDYTDIDADYDPTAYGKEPEERMEEEEVMPKAEKLTSDEFRPREDLSYPASRNYPQTYAPSVAWDPVATISSPYQPPSSVIGQSPGVSRSPSGPSPARSPSAPRPGRMGSSDRFNLPPPPPPPTQQARAPEDRLTSPHRSEVHMTRPLYSDLYSPLTSPDAEPPPPPLVPPPSQTRIPPPSPMYPSAPQPSLLPEEEDFAYLPRGGFTDLDAVSPRTIPAQHSKSSPPVPSASTHSTFPVLQSPPRVIRPASPQSTQDEPYGEPHGEPHSDPHRGSRERR